jgi:hypothetical protein
MSGGVLLDKNTRRLRSGLGLANSSGINHFDREGLEKAKGKTKDIILNAEGKLARLLYHVD